MFAWARCVSMRAVTSGHCRQLSHSWHARCSPGNSTVSAKPSPSKNSEAYRWYHPTAAICKSRDLVPERTLFGCYPSVEAFGLALGADGQGSNHTNERCRHAAELIFTNHIQHLGKGLTYYLDTYSDFAVFQHRTLANARALMPRSTIANTYCTLCR